MGQSPGTHWYHAHKHGSTAINVANGMTGVFIIEGDYDDELNTFYGHGLDAHAAGDGDQPARRQPEPVALRPSARRRAGPGSQDKGPNFSVNGRSQPVVDMQPGEVQMWRIANTSGRSGAYFGGIAPGLQWKQTGAGRRAVRLRQLRQEQPTRPS